MTELTLLRLTGFKAVATQGVLLDSEGIPICVTHELPWKENKPMVSCIPLGSYFCKKVFDRKSGNLVPIKVTYEITQVPNRAGILFHCGNSNRDTLGCVLLGEMFRNGGAMFGQQILNSRDAFQRFIDLLKPIDTFTLKVTSIEDEWTKTVSTNE